MRKRTVRPPSEEEVRIINNEIGELDQWESLGQSNEGKFLHGFITRNIEQVYDDWKNALMIVDDTKLIEFRYSVRSKLQTLKALIARMEDAGQEKKRMELVLAKLLPEQGE